MSASQIAWPRGIYSTEQVREFDRRAIEGLGIEGFELMRRAGQAALEFLEGEWPEARALTIFCGAGNNAGDGYVLAALAARAGLAPRVIAVVDPAALTGDAAAAVAMAREAGLRFETFAAAGDDAGEGAGDDTAAGVDPAAGADLVVDALLGTGLTRDVDGDRAAAVARINEASAPVLALDVPTGLDSDTGAVRGVAVAADGTITFVGLKAGLYLGAGPACRGRLGFADLGLPGEVYRDTPPVLRRLDAGDPARLLEPRSPISHKDMNGQVLVVGGAPGMSGAARLAAEAALRTGAGLVHAAVAPESVAAVMAGRPEIMCRGVAAAGDFADWIATASVIVVGPGLGRSAWGEALARAMLRAEAPLVVDADALNFLAAGQGLQREDWVLTPHPGEAGRLLGCSTAAVQQARRAAVVDLVAGYGGIAVLKGACSLVAGRAASDAAAIEPAAGDAATNDTVAVAVCDHGNPGMATGGMGDVLSGVIGGLVAQFGFSLAAAECAVLLHALAGDDAARDGQRGLVASDLFAPLRRRVNPL